MSAVRPSEHERDKTLSVLREGCAEGRLSDSTLEHRIERALAARTVAELRQLTVDIERVSHVKTWLTRRPARPTPEQARLWLDGIGTRPFLLGRSREADLVLRDESVSRRHAQIVRTSDGFMLADLGSTNGTWLGGRRVGEVEVAPGDVIELGDHPLRLL